LGRGRLSRGSRRWPTRAAAAKRWPRARARRG
jgi:hypothetical protein